MALALAGFMVVNGQLIGTEYTCYDTSGTTYDTDYRFDSLNLSTAQVEGMFEVGGITLGGGAPDLRSSGVSTTDIWLPYRPTGSLRLGRLTLTGNCCTSIISRTSFGSSRCSVSIRLP